MVTVSMIVVGLNVFTDTSETQGQCVLAAYEALQPPTLADLM